MRWRRWWRSRRVVRLDLGDSTERAPAPGDEHSNARRAERSENKLTPYQIVAGDAAPGNRRPRRAVPILDLEISNRGRACHRARGINRAVALPAEHVDLINGLRNVEIHLQPVGI